MTQQDQRPFDGSSRPSETAMSRRCVMGSSDLILMGLLSTSGLCQDARRKSDAKYYRRQEDSRIYLERMRNASGGERKQILMEQMARRHQEVLESLKDKLSISDQEWPVIRPKLEAVYFLVHPLRSGNGATSSEVERTRNELRELLRNEEPATDQIKVRLTALRTAKETAHQKLVVAQQNLRELMTLRQEAGLVLQGLLA